MNQATIDALRALADKLGTTSEHLWGVLVRQAPISSATNLTLLVVTAIALVKAGKSLWKYANREEVGVDDEFALGGGSITIAILSIVWMCFTLASAEHIIAGFVNPEFEALGYILSTLGK